MRALIIFVVLISLSLTTSAQEITGFPFGKTSYSDLEFNEYKADTSAGAVVINEFGEAFVENRNDHNIIFQYHVKIKILKKHALDAADFEIPLYRNETKSEKLRSVKASSFNIENGSMREVRLEDKNVFTEDKGHYDLKKFAVPNVRVGSVIEVAYEIESPFFFNFRSWEFQSEYPKIYSEYWATIPANYVYNITLKGFLKPIKNESERVIGCFGTGGGADCARYKFAMEFIPAFIIEEYMTAPSNFISAVNFELSEVIQLDGHRDKMTSQWKDAELEMKRNDKFGVQLKRGKDIADLIGPLIAGETDSLVIAKKVYNFVRDWYRWNEGYGMFSEFGIRKAFDTKTGNIGDINLSLITALRFAGLYTNPVILSTRKNGLPTDLHPVLSDFNYVVARVTINKKSFLLDASDDFYPFGLLPERCLNGKGRVLTEEGSSWVELRPANKRKSITNIILKLDSTGSLKGTTKTTYIGYEAVNMRKEIFEFNDEAEYIKDLKNNEKEFEIENVTIENYSDLESPLIKKMEINIPAAASGNNSFLFNPFLENRWTKNPFKANERLYPVDFGPPLEEIVSITIQYPQGYEIANLPEKTIVTLPNSSGRFALEYSNVDRVFKLSSSLMIVKSVFFSPEYPQLKEMFNVVTQIQNSDLLFKAAN
jgi:hypothetical protein